MERKKENALAQPPQLQEVNSQNAHALHITIAEVLLGKVDMERQMI